MSKAPAILVLIIAILSGLFASASVMRYINSHKAPGSASGPVKKVLVAKEDIPSGSALRPELVVVVERSPAIIPSQTFASYSEVKDRMVRSTIYRGEYVLGERLVDSGSPSGLPALIPMGMRAITLKVDETVSVAGFVQPGHNVDIVGTVEVEDKNQGTVSKVILQNIRVLATGQEIESKEDQKAKVVPTVTVLVTLEQAERLALATKIGGIRLVLRNYKDEEFEKTDGVNLSTLITNERNPIPEPTPAVADVLPEVTATAPDLHTVVLYRGTERSEVNFSR